MPSDILLRRTFEENLPWLMAAAGKKAEPTPPEVAEAILGGVKVALPPLREVLQEFV